jgi:hypothetical protein
MKLRTFKRLPVMIAVPAILLCGIAQLMHESSIRVSYEPGVTMTTTAETSTIRWWFAQ